MSVEVRDLNETSDCLPSILGLMKTLCRTPSSIEYLPLASFSPTVQLDKTQVTQHWRSNHRPISRTEYEATEIEL